MVPDAQWMAVATECLVKISECEVVCLLWCEISANAKWSFCSVNLYECRGVTVRHSANAKWRFCSVNLYECHGVRHSVNARWRFCSVNLDDCCGTRLSVNAKWRCHNVYSKCEVKASQNEQQMPGEGSTMWIANAKWQFCSVNLYDCCCARCSVNAKLKLLRLSVNLHDCCEARCSVNTV